MTQKSLYFLDFYSDLLSYLLSYFLKDIASELINRRYLEISKYTKIKFVMKVVYFEEYDVLSDS